MPMFPLATALLPYQALPLHIFEPRYRQLMADVVGATDAFGISLITRGAEVGGGERRSEVGTIGHIVSSEQLEDGRWLIIVVGTQRVRVTSWLDDAPYPRADVAVLEEPTPTADDLRRREQMEDTLTRVLTLESQLTNSQHTAVEMVDDPLMRLWQPAVVAPLTPFDAQRLLEADSWSSRLDILDDALTSLEAMLQFRVQGDTSGN